MVKHIGKQLPGTPRIGWVIIMEHKDVGCVDAYWNEVDQNCFSYSSDVWVYFEIKSLTAICYTTFKA
jgi:hypothetical protein